MAQGTIKGDRAFPRSTERIIALDAARGIALLVACIAHFPVMQFLGEHPQKNMLLLDLLQITKLATPTFIFVSSMVLGYLCGVPRKDGQQFRVRLFDRAIFLATVGHCLMAITLMKAPQNFLTALSRGYVTDTIAYCVIGSLLVLPYTKPLMRVQMGIGLYVISWAGWTLWHPDSSGLMLSKGILLGPDEMGDDIFGFPLLPWFAVYLSGTSIGEWLSRFDGEALALAGKNLAKHSGVVLFVAVMMYGALQVFIKVHHSAGLLELYSRIRVLVSPTIKYPPGPYYLLVFGSMALLLIGSALWKMRETHNERWLRCLQILEQVGRNSFPLFIIHFLIYGPLFVLVVTRTQAMTPARGVLFLLLSLLGIIALGVLCNRFRVNRFLTVGLFAITKQWPILSRSIPITPTRHPIVLNSEIQIDCSSAASGPKSDKAA